MNKVQTIVMAGGVGERLQPLTRGRSKAAVPFGGKYLIVDFTLSNCINSGIRQISVLTQYLSDSLHRHIQNGWGISGSRLGDYIYCVPAQQKIGTDWYRGTADAIRQNLDLIKGKAGDPVMILSGDHIYKMDYRQIVAYHKIKKADITISAVRLRTEEAAERLGVLEEDQDHRVVGFEEKPDLQKTINEAPEYVLGSMGVYIFKVGVLREALQEPEDDFGKGVIPKALNRGCSVFVYDYEKENKIEDFVVEVKEGTRHKVLVDRTRDSSYWKDIGSIDSYHEASMDLVSVDPPFNLYGEQWPFRASERSLPPSKFIFGGKAPDSMVSDGCIISGGTVWRSILSPGVIVERDALVEESIVFDDVNIEPGAKIRRAIIDTQVRIRSGVSIGYDLEADTRKCCTISDKGIVVVPAGMVIGPD
ncbi:sugar phosphate nucleotidyltransferase [Chloroflexota bacterium]